MLMDKLDYQSLQFFLFKLKSVVKISAVIYILFSACSSSVGGV